MRGGTSRSSLRRDAFGGSLWNRLKFMIDLFALSMVYMGEGYARLMVGYAGLRTSLEPAVSGLKT